MRNANEEDSFDHSSSPDAVSFGSLGPDIRCFVEAGGRGQKQGSPQDGYGRTAAGGGQGLERACLRSAAEVGSDACTFAVRACSRLAAAFRQAARTSGRCHTGRGAESGL